MSGSCLNNLPVMLDPENMEVILLLSGLPTYICVPAFSEPSCFISNFRLLAKLLTIISVTQMECPYLKVRGEGRGFCLKIDFKEI